MKGLKIQATDIILALILLVLSSAVIISINCQRYETATSITVIIASVMIPFCIKNLELEKHRRQFLYEKKYNAYSKYFSILDDFWKISGKTVFNMHIFNTENFKTEQDFEAQKRIVLDLYQKFIQVRDYLAMPGLEILIFVNKKVENKIKEIVDIDAENQLMINHRDDLQVNMLKVEKYIGKLAELARLLQEDLEIEENKC